MGSVPGSETTTAAQHACAATSRCHAMAMGASYAPAKTACQKIARRPSSAHLYKAREILNCTCQLTCDCKIALARGGAARANGGASRDVGGGEPMQNSTGYKIRTSQQHESLPIKS